MRPHLRSPHRDIVLVFLFAVLPLQACARADSRDQTATSTPPPVSASQDRSLENLVAFTRLLGYVRHFHPSDAAAAIDWEAFAVRGVLSVETAPSPEDLADRLRTLFGPIAPTVRIFITGQPAPTIELSREGESRVYVVYWKHIGYGGGIYQQIGYSSERIWTPIQARTSGSNIPDPSQPFAAELGGGISALIPLALFADEQGTLPLAPSIPKYELPSPRDTRAEHLATAALAWNVFQHFYPYFDVVPVDWFGVLRETLTAAQTNQDEYAFLLTLRRMLARLDDGHGAVGAASTGATAITMLANPPWDWIDNQLVLTLVRPSEQLHPGDTVLRINGQDARTLVKDEEEYVSASTVQHRRAMAVRYLWAHLTDDPMTLEVQTRSGAIVAVTRSRGEICCIKPTRRPALEEIKPRILYVDLAQLTTADFENAIPQMQQASGILFDGRGGYLGRLNVSTLGHLTDVPMKWEKFYWPIITYPDHQNMSFRIDEPTVDSQKPRLTAKVAFLTDVSALSYSESYLAFVEQYKLGEIVGEPTAGMTGGIDPFTLFNQYTFNWTGTKVLKQDGSRHHGIGILPSIPVSRTIQAIAEGRDEVLERALQIVSE